MAAADKQDADFAEYVAARSLWLRRVAFLLCHDSDRADDLVQTSITKLYIHWPRVVELANLDGYVRTILVNTYLAEQRSPWWKRVTLGHEPTADAAASKDPNPDLALDLGAALASITPRQRAVLVLRFYCDLSVEDAAGQLGCSIGNVKSQTSRGLAAMRRILEPPDTTSHAGAGAGADARGPQDRTGSTRTTSALDTRTAPTPRATRNVPPRNVPPRAVPAPSAGTTAFPEGS
ncbi:SigE family RNA polymerase sigma factor [Actinospica durhamensis]|uniref:SigE family RNA polymerase sigma factor n=1 Tax=Actinospica durhamensis TaxID=1508375 RepID=A0A941IR75_9ACTN|nr:SigE family RNA polymerase sigma factor [Actinospica durhamensis]MBR7838500.1 SigE family RNA polymerase sigma factor [Actinospica durhamensis]